MYDYVEARLVPRRISCETHSSRVVTIGILSEDFRHLGSSHHILILNNVEMARKTILLDSEAQSQKPNI